MKKILIIIFSSLALLLVGCQENLKGDGNRQTVLRTLPTFNTIRVVGNYIVNINAGPTQQVAVTADDNLIPYVITSVNDNTLTVKTKRGYFLQTNQTPQLDISMNQLSDIGIIENGTVNASGINTDKLIIKMMGMGNANVSGNTKEIKIELLGSGQIVANNLLAEKADVKLLGAGNISVFASKKLTIKLSGSGKVQFYGEPREVEQKIAGNGEVIGIPNAQENSTQNSG